MEPSATQQAETASPERVSAAISRQSGASYLTCQKPGADLPPIPEPRDSNPQLILAAVLHQSKRRRSWYAPPPAYDHRVSTLLRLRVPCLRTELVVSAAMTLSTTTTVALSATAAMTLSSTTTAMTLSASTAVGLSTAITVRSFCTACAGSRPSAM